MLQLCPAITARSKCPALYRYDTQTSCVPATHVAIEVVTAPGVPYTRGYTMPRSSVASDSTESGHVQPSTCSVPFGTVTVLVLAASSTENATTS